MPKKKKSFTDKLVSLKGIAILIGILLILAGFAYFYAKKDMMQNARKVVPTPTATPTPRPIPHGKIGFGVGGSVPEAPKFGRGFLNPYDPAKGTSQVVSIEMTDTVDIESITGVMKTDHEQYQLTFSLVEGTKQKGRWEATWTVTDSYLYTYELNLRAKNAKTSDNVDIMLR